MSTFAVTIKKLSKVWTHPNADRLELGQIEGCEYNFVILKGQYKVGDDVVYFPIDSILPQELVAKMGLTGKLSGKDKNRIKTVTLRGFQSQGIVAKPTEVLPEPVASNGDWSKWSPDALTQLLGVTKYDPPPVPCHAGNLVKMPPDVPIYDIEGADNYPEVVQALMDVPVYVSEKLEGQNWWLSVQTAPEVVTFGQHNYRIEPIPEAEHDFKKVASRQGLFDLARTLSHNFGGDKVTLRGEYLGPGVQKNIYKLKENVIYLFDIMVSKGPGNYRYLNPEEFLEATKWRSRPDMPILTVPVLAIGVTLRFWLDGKTIREASNGMSLLLATQRREGIVIKPMVEGRQEAIGRNLIKQRSPLYLAESEF